MTDQPLTLGVYRVARIHWRDTTQVPGWHKQPDLDELFNEALPVMQSVGWLVHEDENVVVLAQSVGRYAAADLLKIPRPLIIEIWIDKDV